MTHCAVPAWCKGCGYKGPTLEKRRWKGPECGNDISNLDLTQQLCLGSKETFYEALGQTIKLEIVKRTSGSSMRI
jgi:hypothetical protein